MASTSNWNKGTLSGCTDILVIDQPDGSLASTPFHVRFGKFKVFRTKKKNVKITVNGIEANFTMKLANDGTGIFEEIREVSNAESEEKDESFELFQDGSKLHEKRDSLDSKQEPNSTHAESSEEVKVDSTKDSGIKESKKDSGGFLGLFGSKESPNKEKNGSEWEDEDDQVGEIEISLCASKLTGKKDEDVNTFKKNKVPYKKYIHKPSKIIDDPELIIKYQEEFYTWESASQLLISSLVYKKELPKDLRQKLLEKQKKKSSSWSLFSFGKKSEKKSNSDNEAPKAQDQDVEIVCFSTPKSAMLKSLNLNYGQNEITYTVKSKLRGTQVLKAYIYYYKPDAKIVISDVDGTITKSDVRGQLYPMLGISWSQPGITELYTNINQNGYIVLYLTARSMGQSNQVRAYLTNLIQNQSILPIGPIMTSSDRLGSAFKREVLDKQPHVFKIAFLQEIKNLFPSNVNPFFAGFGNKVTDKIAYDSVEIDPNRIFIVNPKSEITIESGIRSSYVDLNSKLLDLFPPINIHEKTEHNL